MTAPTCYHYQFRESNEWSCLFEPMAIELINPIILIVINFFTSTGADVLIYHLYDDMGPRHVIDGTILFTKPRTH